MENKYTALVRIGVTQLTTGAAEAEGRAPSHDGEYVTIYSVDGDWVGSSNGGSFGEDDLRDGYSDEDEEHLERELNRAQAATRAPDNYIDVGTEFYGYVGGAAATDDMIASGWLAESQGDDE